MIQQYLQEILINRDKIIRTNDHLGFIPFRTKIPLALNNLEWLNRELYHSLQKQNQKDKSHHYTFNENHIQHIESKLQPEHIPEKLSLKFTANQKYLQNFNSNIKQKTNYFICKQKSQNKKDILHQTDNERLSPYLKLNKPNNNKITKNPSIESAKKQKDQIFERYKNIKTFDMINNNNHQQLKINNFKEKNQQYNINDRVNDKKQKIIQQFKQHTNPNSFNHNINIDYDSSKHQTIQSNSSLKFNKKHKTKYTQFIRSPMINNLDALNSTMKFTPQKKRNVSFLGCENSGKTLRQKNKFTYLKDQFRSKSKSKSKSQKAFQQSGIKSQNGKKTEERSISKSPLTSRTPFRQINRQSQKNKSVKLFNYKSFNNKQKELQLIPSQFNFQQKLLKKIQKRIDSSVKLFQDSEMCTLKHEQNHLQMTYQRQRKIRNQMKNKINDHPNILKKYDKVFQFDN